MVKSEVCPNCGGNEITFALQCNYCGSRLERKAENLVIASVGYRCTRCHIDNLPTSEFCHQCGERVQKKCGHCKGIHHVTSLFCPVSGFALLEKAVKTFTVPYDEIKTRIDRESVLMSAIFKEVDTKYGLDNSSLTITEADTAKPGISNEIPPAVKYRK